MKLKNISVVICTLVLFSANAFVVKDFKSQEKKTVTMVGTFDGYDAEDGYAFLVKSTDSEEEGEQTLYLQSISVEALKKVNLKSKEMEGKRFEVVCEVSEHVEKDDNGQEETYESYHIISIKKL